METLETGAIPRDSAEISRASWWSALGLDRKSKSLF
jgi:hypothetical protein